LKSHNFDIKLLDGKIRFCESYTLNKQYVISNHKSQPRAEARFDKIYINIANEGAILLSVITEAIEDSEFDYKNASQFLIRGARYFIFIINDYFRYR
jgi:hypothetical protein